MHFVFDFIYSSPSSYYDGCQSDYISVNGAGNQQAGMGLPLPF